MSTFYADSMTSSKSFFIFINIRNKADVITKDSLFIPSGYDNLNII
jgi:hypothetical protein